LDYNAYWKLKSASGQRYNSEEFYELKAIEHTSFIKQSELLLGSIDVGCGAGELLYYIAKLCKVEVGIDFSESMLSAARIRLSNRNILLINDNTFQFLRQTTIPIWLASQSINQFLDIYAQCRLLDIFLDNKFVKSFYLYDCIDPLRYLLFSYGAINRYDSAKPLPRIGSMLAFIKGLVISVFNPSKFYYSEFGSAMGFGFAPGFWLDECAKRGLIVKICSSKYYEYRYHVIIHKSEMSTQIGSNKFNDK
jgi:SAM-dependent methyltransferase